MFLKVTWSSCGGRLLRSSLPGSHRCQSRDHAPLTHRVASAYEVNRPLDQQVESLLPRCFVGGQIGSLLDPGEPDGDLHSGGDAPEDVVPFLVSELARPSPPMPFALDAELVDGSGDDVRQVAVERPEVLAGEPRCRRCAKTRTLRRVSAQSVHFDTDSASAIQGFLPSSTCSRSPKPVQDLRCCSIGCRRTGAPLRRRPEPTLDQPVMGACRPGLAP